MRLIDEAYLKTSWYGSRRMVRHLSDGWVNRCRVRRMIRLMGLRSVAPRQSMAQRVRSQIEAAYRRLGLFERRRRLTDDWAGYPRPTTLKLLPRKENC